MAQIPAGSVDSYGGVARRAGLGRGARQVGHALKVAPAGLDLPWHRVVNASGRISFPRGSPQYLLQRRRLEAEGVRFVGERVASWRTGAAADDLDVLLWKPRDGS